MGEVKRDLRYCTGYEHDFSEAIYHTLVLRE